MLRSYSDAAVAPVFFLTDYIQTSSQHLFYLLSRIQPKRFNNDPYSHIHGDTSLRGNRPLPQEGKAFKEFPAIRNNPSGWTSTGPVGAMRTITYKEGGRRSLGTIQVAVVVRITTMLLKLQGSLSSRIWTTSSKGSYLFEL